ncbi:MAG TPA: NAD(P)H-hydrate dehydratase, partial [Bacteroidales bacterium]|nr:NAD(P)H-hydrate dehydratase [Bacteroidales bacterium]
NEMFVGNYHVLDIGLHPDFIESVKTPYTFIEQETIESYIIPRTRFAHKGDFGHALLIAGSYGKMGACVLAAKAALRSGIGLLTVHIPSKGYNIIQTSVPEAMASIDFDAKVFTYLPRLTQHNAIGIGPGIGVHKASKDAFFKLLKKNLPLVIDADGINMLAKKPEWIKLIPHDSILTPHPKEFDRLVGESQNSYERLQKQILLAKDINSIVIVKGHFTAIATPNGKVFFNTTGNAGMATGGSGDVLTGIILSLVAQGFLPCEAALTGVFIHGLAADMAVKTLSQTSLIASDIIDALPEVFLSLENNE